MFRGSGQSYGNATQTITNNLDHFKIYTIVPIIWIELNSIQALEVISVIRVVCDRLGNISIWSSRSSEHFFEMNGTIRTIIWKPGLKCLWSKKQLLLIWKAFQSKEEWCFPFWHISPHLHNTKTWISLKQKKIIQKGKCHSSLPWKAF